MSLRRLFTSDESGIASMSSAGRDHGLSDSLDGDRTGCESALRLLFVEDSWHLVADAQHHRLRDPAAFS